MDQEIESFMKLYDYSPPSLLLFDNLLEMDYAKEEKIISDVLTMNNEKLNPMRIVVESMININAEKISSQTLTYSKDKVIIRPDIRSMSIQEVVQLIKNDPNKLRIFHKIWSEKLLAFLKNLYQNKKNLKIDDAIFLVSKKFRISASSSIKAIISVIA